MKNDSSTNRIPSTIPSDDQVESLLCEFFRLEVPTGLSQPLRRGQLPTLSIVDSAKADRSHPESTQQPRSVRMVAVATSVAAMALALLIAITGDNSSLVNHGTAVNGVNDAPGTNSVTDKPMLVSPEGESRASEKAITPDGVTLEETDSIDLHQ